MPFIGAAVIRIWSRTFGASGTAQHPPLSAPRNLVPMETMGNPGYVDFSWLPPLSWGAAGPHATDRFQYQFRLESASTGNLNNYGPVINDHNALTARVHWAAGHRHGDNRMQFRVRSRDADGATSAWVESAILTENAVNPRRGRFSQRFSRRFQ